MQILIETEDRSRPMHLKLPTGLVCSALTGAILNMAFRKAQKKAHTAELPREPGRDSDDDCAGITLSDDAVYAVAAAEEGIPLPWREIMRSLRAFSIKHPDFALCEIWSANAHVKITL